MMDRCVKRKKLHDDIKVERAERCKWDTLYVAISKLRLVLFPFVMELSGNYIHQTRIKILNYYNMCNCDSK